MSITKKLRKKLQRREKKDRNKQIKKTSMRCILMGNIEPEITKENIWFRLLNCNKCQERR